MRAVVTGAAGFIGSHVAEALVARGWDVLGIDAFTDTYPARQKRTNLSSLSRRDGFDLLETDLRSADLAKFVGGGDVLFHLAAIPGVRASWSSRFSDYVETNVLVTHRLLEAARNLGLGRVVYASSSSVYGNALRYPCRESDVPHPHSPYGVTKLAAENLCSAYAGNFGVPVVSLRYFSVYGPRQRPDMGVHRIIEAALGRSTFSVFGTGAQMRDMTFVDDVVEATILAATEDVPPGSVLNIAGGSEISVNDIIQRVGSILGGEVPHQWASEQPGDVYRTGGDTKAARELLGWRPATTIDAGLRAQVRWHEELAAG